MPKGYALVRGPPMGEALLKTSMIPGPKAWKVRGLDASDRSVLHTGVISGDVCIFEHPGAIQAKPPPPWAAPMH